jgi:glycosyltransferase involved in cell wall biosynthesis
MNDSKFIIFSDSSKNIGGQELQALQQMRSLNSAGHQTLLLAKSGSAILERATFEGLSTIEVGFRNAFHIPSLLKIWNIVKVKRPDAMICHGSHDALICALVSKLAGWLGGQSVPVLRIKTFQHGYPLSFAYNYLFSKTITPSQFLREKFLVNKSIDSQKIQVLYPGIDFSGLDNGVDVLPPHVQNWLNDHPGPVISHGAILRGEKGHSIILKALVQVKKSFPNVRYLIAGDGQDRSLLEAEILALNLEDNVLLTGIFHKIAPLLKKSDLAVLPSLIEPLGMFQIEAQYLEIPTIASNTGGTPETLLDQKTGLLVQPGDIEQWAKAIMWMLSNPSAGKDMAREGKHYVQNKFSLEVNTAGLLSLIQST